MSFIGAVRKGECESPWCSDDAGVEKKVILCHGNIWMCDECRIKEHKLGESVRSANKTIEAARKVDESLLIKQDIYNAKTIADVEIKAAIWADESIPESEKQFAYTKECENRLKLQTELVFSMREQLREAENLRKMWQITTQDAASMLRADQRAFFANLDVKYQPEVKTIKPKKEKEKKVVVGHRAFMNSVKEAAEKFGVPVTALNAMMIGNKKPVETVAKTLAEMMAGKSAAQ